MVAGELVPDDGRRTKLTDGELVQDSEQEERRGTGKLIPDASTDDKTTTRPPRGPIGQGCGGADTTMQRGETSTSR